MLWIKKNQFSLGKHGEKKTENKDYCRSHQVNKYREDDKTRKQLARDALKVLKPAQYEINLKADCIRKRLDNAEALTWRPPTRTTTCFLVHYWTFSVSVIGTFLRLASPTSRADKALPKSLTKKKQLSVAVICHVPTRRK